MTYDIWLKLVKFEIAGICARGIRFADKQIEEYQKIGEKENSIFSEEQYKNYTTEDVAKLVCDYFHKCNEERKIREDIDHKKAMRSRREKFAKIREELESMPAKSYPDYSLEFQLGLYIGEQIERNYLPCLSVDGVTNNSIEMSEEDIFEYEKIHNALDTVPEREKLGDSQQWKSYIDFRYMLYKKYLPEKLDCWVNRIYSITNMEDLKKGIETYLWNCDNCNYDTSRIEINNNDVMHRSIVTLYRDKQE